MTITLKNSSKAEIGIFRLQENSTNIYSYNRLVELTGQSLINIFLFHVYDMVLNRTNSIHIQ